MEAEGHHQVTDVGMVVAVVAEEVAVTVLVGAVLASLAILNFEVCLFRDSFFDIKNDRQHMLNGIL